MRDPRLDHDPDFILSPKNNNSLKVLLKRNPNGVSDRVIARVLNISEEEVEKTYQMVVQKLRKVMVEENE
jgi:hypothetical protein